MQRLLRLLDRFLEDLQQVLGGPPGRVLEAAEFDLGRRFDLSEAAHFAAELGLAGAVVLSLMWKASRLTQNPP